MNNKAIIKFLDSITKDANDKEITVVPLMCGTGKSAYISHKMCEVIKENSKSGLLIVTDSVDRMNGYQLPFNDELKSLIAENEKKILIMTAANVGKAMRDHKNKPILIISTQRYFRLTKKELIDLLTWRNGKRCLVMFDEKPYLTEQIKVTIKTFTDINAVLQMAIDDTADQQEKAWAINQWQMLERRMQSIMDEYEGIQEGQFSLFHKDNGFMTTDDDRFMQIVEKNKYAIHAKDPNAYINVCAIRQLVKNGAIYTCRKRKTGEYEKFFTVLIDHREKMLGLSAKVVVLDATGDISPDYRNDYTRILPCTQFKRNLSNLMINIINVPTSKRCFAAKGSGKHIDMIVRSISNMYKNQENPVIFTYKEIEGRFAAHFSTAHLGDIKGRNDFRDKRNIVQIGLNRFPPIYYYCLYLAQNADEQDMLKKLSKRESLDYLTKILNDPKSNEEIMNRCLLADLEQNMFRSAIRNPENTDNVDFTVLFNTDEHENLVSMIRSRYEKMGATVRILPPPAEFYKEKIISRKTDTPSYAQKITEWIYSKPNGTEFKLSDMLHDIGIDSKKFDKIKQKNTGLHKLLKDMSTGRKGFYRVAYE